MLARKRPHVVVRRRWSDFRAEVRDFPEGFNSVPKSMLWIMEAAASKALAASA